MTEDTTNNTTTEQLAGMTMAEPDAIATRGIPMLAAKALMVSLAAHVVFVLITSFGLYSDWAEYGVKMPNTIKQIKKANTVAAGKAEREAKIKAEEEIRLKRDAEAAAAGNEKTADTDKTVEEADADASVIDSADPARSFKLDSNMLDL